MGQWEECRIRDHPGVTCHACPESLLQTTRTLHLPTPVCRTLFLSTSCVPGGTGSIAGSWLPSLLLCQMYPAVAITPSDEQASMGAAPQPQYTAMITAILERRPVPSAPVLPGKASAPEKNSAFGGRESHEGDLCILQFQGARRCSKQKKGRRKQKQESKCYKKKRLEGNTLQR